MTTQHVARNRSSSEFFEGVKLLGKGFHTWVTAPKLMWLGVVPALIVAGFFAAAIVGLFFFAEQIVTWATPFANDWDETFRVAFRFIVVVAAFVVIVQLIVYAFTTVTLLAGDYFYEKIWLHVENERGGIPPTTERSWWSKLGLGIADAIRIFVPTVFLGLAIFLVGLIPVIGQVTATVLGAFVGGWFLAIELTGRAFQARGFTQQERRRMLGSRRPLTLGFGVASFLVFLIPFGAVVAMPAAVAGATFLSRKVLDERMPTSAQVSVDR